MKKGYLAIILICIISSSQVYSESQEYTYNQVLELYNNSEQDLALAGIQYLLKEHPEDPKVLKLASDIYISNDLFGKARALLNTLIEIDPKDTEAMISLARLGSWIGKTSESVAFYDKAIILDPDNVYIHVEKARVLAWGERYNASLKAYEQAYIRFNRKWIYYEMLAKKHLWNKRIRKAVEMAETSLKMKSNNTEILYDLGQLNSFAGDYKTANGYYKKLLQVDPYQSAAKLSLRKNDIVSRAYNLKLSMSGWNADSVERSTSVDMLSRQLSFDSMISNTVGLMLKYNSSLYRYAEETNIRETAIGAALSYSKPFSYSGVFGLTGKTFNLGIEDKSSYFLTWWYRVLDEIALTLSYHKENMINNRDNILDDYSDLYFKMKIDYDMNRGLSLGCDYRSGRIAEENTYRIAGADCNTIILRKPLSLYTKIRMESWEYEKESDRYYAPASYLRYSLTAGIKHKLSKGGTYYGKNYVGYELRHCIIWDSNDETTLQPELLFRADITERINISARFSLTDSYYYEDNAWDVGLGLIF